MNKLNPGDVFKFVFPNEPQFGHLWYQPKLCRGYTTCYTVRNSKHIFVLLQQNNNEIYYLDFNNHIIRIPLPVFDLGNKQITIEKIT